MTLERGDHGGLAQMTGGSARSTAAGRCVAGTTSPVHAADSPRPGRAGPTSAVRNHPTQRGFAGPAAESGTTPIRGREKRRDGILRNTLYAGRIVWRRRLSLSWPGRGAAPGRPRVARPRPCAVRQFGEAGSRGGAPALLPPRQLGIAAVTRHTTPPTSSATSSAPSLSRATPTGRPWAWPLALRKSDSTTWGMPSGLPLAKGM